MSTLSFSSAVKVPSVSFSLDVLAVELGLGATAVFALIAVRPLGQQTNSHRRVGRPDPERCSASS